MTAVLPNIVIDDGIPYAEAAFSAFGSITRLPGREIAREHLIGADVLIVRTITKVNEALLRGTPVKFVGSCTIGIDHLDTRWLDSAGIHWCHAPGCNANAVAEYVFSAIAANEGVFPALVRGEGRVGLIGFGNVGQRVARRCQLLGIAVVAYDPFLESAQHPELSALENVLQSEVVSLHTPLTTAGPYPTRHLLSADQMAQLPRGAMLINTARGGVLANSALLALAQTRGDIRLVLDVWEHEPEIDASLAWASTLSTPHIAGYSREGKLAGTTMVMNRLAEFLEMPAAVLQPSEISMPAIDLQGPVSVETGDLLQSLIRCLYDIKADHAMFRQELTSNNYGWFEMLRRSYQPRPEWQGLTVTSENSDLQRLIDEWLPQLSGGNL